MLAILRAFHKKMTEEFEPASKEKKQLFSDPEYKPAYRIVMDPDPQPTKDNVVTNQVIRLLEVNDFNTAYKIIELELKKENDATQLDKIIWLVGQIKSQLIQYNKRVGEYNDKHRPGILRLFDVPRIELIPKLNILEQQAIIAREALVGLPPSSSVPPQAPVLHRKNS